MWKTLLFGRTILETWVYMITYNYMTCFILTLYLWKWHFVTHFCMILLLTIYKILTETRKNLIIHLQYIFKHTHAQIIKKLVIYHSELFSFWNDNLGLFLEKNCEYHRRCLAINWSSLTNIGLDTYVLLFHIITSRSTYEIQAHITCTRYTSIRKISDFTWGSYK